MESPSPFRNHFHQILPFSCTKFSTFTKSFLGFFVSHHFWLSEKTQLWIHLCYFITISLAGFVLLKLLDPKNSMNRPGNLDMLFMSVSATTVSSMGTVEMEVFSNSQLIVLTVLMLVGGEIFTSLLSLQLRRLKFRKQELKEEIEETNGFHHQRRTDDLINARELKLRISSSSDFDTQDLNSTGSDSESQDLKFDTRELKYKSLNYLGFVVLGFLLIFHLIGSALIGIYFIFVSSAKTILRNKGIQTLTFSVFTTVSSFANCGFIPTNENMVIFQKDSILLLIIIPQILLGNTLFAPALRYVLWVLRRITKREELEYLLKNSREIGYEHLLPVLDSVLLVATVVGFTVIQFIMFCSLEWKSEILGGLDSYEKIIGGLFESVNARHAGESVVDISVLSPALLVLYVFMMYLPPYTSFLPIEGEKIYKDKGGGFLKNVMPPQLAWVAIFITIICITERRKMFEDPLNFNVLNVVIEVVSAYGNVGFSTGYSCQRLLKVSPGAYCKDASYGFSGKWSKGGKSVLIVVMFFGRLKRFSLHGGKAWVTR